MRGFIAKINDLRTDQDKYQQSYSINLEKVLKIKLN